MRVWEGSGWTMCSARGLREHLSAARPVPVESIPPAHMLKMLESGACQVCSDSFMWCIVYGVVLDTCA